MTLVDTCLQTCYKNVWCLKTLIFSSVNAPRQLFCTFLTKLIFNFLLLSSSYTPNKKLSVAKLKYIQTSQSNSDLYSTYRTQLFYRQKQL